MKKFIAISMAAVMALSLAGCSAATTAKEYYDDYYKCNVVEEYNDKELMIKQSLYREGGIRYDYNADGEIISQEEF